MKRVRVPVVIYAQVEFEGEVVGKVAIYEFRIEDGFFIYLKPFAGPCAYSYNFGGTIRVPSFREVANFGISPSGGKENDSVCT